MPRIVPLLICFALVFYFLRYDAQKKPNVSYGLWIPWFWFAIHASRAVSSWFGAGVTEASSDYYLEGSPFDRNVFIALIVMGLMILVSRKPRWDLIFKSNKFILLYIAYLGLSASWSDFAFVSFKRWIKEIGHIIMILVILTEVSPEEAIKTLIIRCAYVLVPISWVLNRYFPEISRVYSIGGGDPQLIGITTNKNSLGIVCLISGVVLFWKFVNDWLQSKEKENKKDLLIYVLMGITISWVLLNSRSATALGGTIIGCTMIFMLSTKHVRSNISSIGFYIFAGLIILSFLHLTLDIITLATSILGRDETLTGRTEFWEELIAFGTNPLIGVGYESFWLGDRIAFFWQKYWWHPNQAHNGYLELYLNIGLIGLSLLFILILYSIFNIVKNLKNNQYYNYQVLRITFIVIVLIINYTEAYFKGTVWFIFLMMAMDYPIYKLNQAAMLDEITAQHEK